MASATKRSQGKWLGRYRDETGRERTKTFATKGDALAWARAKEASVERGEHVDPSRSRITIEEWSQEWLDSLRVKPSTRVGYESLMRNQVLPRWGSVRLNQIAPADVRKWIASMEGTISAGRIKQAFHVLSSMLDLAVIDRRLPRNPAKPNGSAKGLLPKVTKTKEHVYLTHDQLRRLADEVGEARPLILLLGYSGLRWGEAVALRVRDVDLLHKRVSVNRTAVELHGVVQYGSPKTNEVRTVVIPAALRDELSPLLAGKSANDLLFSAPGGGPLRTSNFRSRTFDRAAERAGLRLTPHDLRHTAASLAISAGANAKAVQRMLGHASAAMTLDTYAGLFDTDAEALADRMDSAILGARADYLRIPTPTAIAVDAGQSDIHAV